MLNSLSLVVCYFQYILSKCATCAEKGREREKKRKSERRSGQWGRKEEIRSD